MALEYIVGPVLALLVGMKFTHFTAAKQSAQIDAVKELIDSKLVESNTEMSQQTLKVLMPLAKSVTDINKQLGL
jgi:hypothetical protein